VMQQKYAPMFFICLNKTVATSAVPLLLLVVTVAITACAPPESDQVPSILLFNGTGTSPNDVVAVETILKERHLD